MESLVTDVANITFRDDRIVEVVEKDGATMNVDEIVKSIELIAKRSNYPTVILTVTRHPLSISPETYLKISRAPQVVALAMVTQAKQSDLIKNQNLMPQKEAYPVMFFEEKGYATAWLRRQVYIHLMYPRPERQGR